MDALQRIVTQEPARIAGDGLSKATHAIKAIETGTPRVHVLDGRVFDGLLNEVLSTGVVEWQLGRATDGAFDAPFDEWKWELDIRKQGLGDPYEVTAIAHDIRGTEYRVDTLLAPRPENTEEPTRAPTTPIDRQARYDAQTQPQQ